MFKKNKPISDAPSQGHDTVEVNVRLRHFIATVFFSCLAIQLLMVFLNYYVNYSYWTEIGALRRLCNITREDGLAS